MTTAAWTTAYALYVGLMETDKRGGGYGAPCALSLLRFWFRIKLGPMWKMIQHPAHHGLGQNRWVEVQRHSYRPRAVKQG